MGVDWEEKGARKNSRVQILRNFKVMAVSLGHKYIMCFSSPFGDGKMYSSFRGEGRGKSNSGFMWQLEASSNATSSLSLATAYNGGLAATKEEEEEKEKGREQFANSTFHCVGKPESSKVCTHREEKHLQLQFLFCLSYLEIPSQAAFPSIKC